MTTTEDRTPLRIDQDAWDSRGRFPHINGLSPRHVAAEMEHQYDQAAAVDPVATVRYFPGPNEAIVEREFVLVGLAASLFQATWQERATMHNTFHPTKHLILRDPDAEPGQLFTIAPQHLVQILPKGTQS